MLLNKSSHSKPFPPIMVVFSWVAQTEARNIPCTKKRKHVMNRQLLCQETPEVTTWYAKDTRVANSEVMWFYVRDICHSSTNSAVPAVKKKKKGRL